MDHPIGNVRDSAEAWAGQGLLHDVTIGANATASFPDGFDAGPGWDRPTGWGPPDVAGIISALQ